VRRVNNSSPVSPSAVRRLLVPSSTKLFHLLVDSEKGDRMIVPPFGVTSSRVSSDGLDVHVRNVPGVAGNGDVADEVPDDVNRAASRRR
jgi:hypothetical protein